MRVSIIGGGGLVGSCAAFALQCGGIVSGIDLIDVNPDLCKGQALDLLHGASLVADQRIRATGYEAIPESDMVMITAGLRRKPDESRLDLINRNVELFLNILGQVKGAGPKSEAIVLVVSNPVDVLTYLATTQLGLPPHQVIGVGLSIREVVHSVALDTKRILPVSAHVQGQYGIRDVCISVPTVVGRKGVEAQLEIAIWPKEVSALQHSAQVLRETIDQVQKSNSKAAGKPAAASGPISAGRTAASPRPVRVTMGAGANGNPGPSGSRVTISGLGQGRGQARGGR